MIAARAGVPLRSLSVSANTTETQLASGGAESTSYNSAPDVQAQPNQVTLDATDALPIMTIDATSANPGRADELVSATIASLQTAVAGLDRTEKVHQLDRMTLRQLGAPVNSVIQGTKSIKRPLAGAIVVLVVIFILGLGLDMVVRRRQHSGVPLSGTDAHRRPGPQSSDDPDTAA
jgi:hypothetical protein